MTTREFINKAWYGETRATHCSSVFVDGDRNLYSYGYHYPLLFTVAGKTVRNVRGYSNTTARHISWSRDIDAIDIHTLNTFRLTGTDEQIMAELVRGQKQWVEGRENAIAHHKARGWREDTQAFERKINELNEAILNLEKLEA